MLTNGAVLRCSARLKVCCAAHADEMQSRHTLAHNRHMAFLCSPHKCCITGAGCSKKRVRLPHAVADGQLQRPAAACLPGQGAGYYHHPPALHESRCTFRTYVLPRPACLIMLWRAMHHARWLLCSCGAGSLTGSAGQSAVQHRSIDLHAHCGSARRRGKSMRFPLLAACSCLCSGLLSVVTSIAWSLRSLHPRGAGER